MKTPRQILFERHRAIEPRLNEIRKSALAHLASADKRRNEDGDIVLIPTWRVMLLSLRCHIAGMSAIWLFVLFLNFEQSSVSTTTIAKKNSSSPQQVVTALLENRRQVAELTSSPANEIPAIPVPQSFFPPRRSEFAFPTEMA